MSLKEYQKQRGQRSYDMTKDLKHGMNSQNQFNIQVEDLEGKKELTNTVHGDGTELDPNQTKSHQRA